MRIVPPLLGLLLFPMVAFGKDTAYQALRALSAERDKSVLNRVIEVKGYNGMPQPDSWVVLLDDPAARGGVREVEVSNGKVISERTPMNTAGISPVINFQKLNLDSTGAFSLADQTARNTKVGFDAVNYTLKKDEETGASVWVLELLDANNRSLGTVTIGAETGTLVANRLNPSELLKEAVVKEEEYLEDEARGVKKKIKRTVKGTAKDVGNTLDRTYHKVKDGVKSIFSRD